VLLGCAASAGQRYKAKNETEVVPSAAIREGINPNVMAEDVTNQSEGRTPAMPYARKEARQAGAFWKGLGTRMPSTPNKG
jgi:hypothetical protein